jgi:hypothetical protein
MVQFPLDKNQSKFYLKNPLERIFLSWAGTGTCGRVWQDPNTLRLAITPCLCVSRSYMLHAHHLPVGYTKIFVGRTRAEKIIRKMRFKVGGKLENEKINRKIRLQFVSTSPRGIKSSYFFRFPPTFGIFLLFFQFRFQFFSVFSLSYDVFMIFKASVGVSRTAKCSDKKLYIACKKMAGWPRLYI